MAETNERISAQKEAAAGYAAQLVQPDMVVGLGTGTTAALLVEHLGQRVAQGLRFVGVPTSEATGQLARSLGITVSSLDQYPQLDLVLDGADEVDSHLNLIKGGGGALLREKIVALAGRRYVIIVDEGKLVDHLGQHMPLPIEVTQFGWTTTRHALQELGFECQRRGEDLPFITDGGNYILDCRGPSLHLSDPALARHIKLRTGVIEHGLFLSMAGLVVVGTDQGVQLLAPADGKPGKVNGAQ